MKQPPFFLLMLVFLVMLQCRHSGRLEKSFDQICQLVAGRTASEVESLLGAPDVREKILVDDERWVWWRYTYLDGNDYAPEVRGQVVHLEITFQNPSPGGARKPYSKWRIVSRYGVSYSGLVLPAMRDSANRNSVKRVLKHDSKGDPGP